MVWGKTYLMVWRW